MAAFIPFANCVEVVMFFLHQAITWNLTFGVLCPSAPDLTMLDLIHDTFDDWWENELKAQVSTNETLTAIKCTDLTTQSGPVLEAPPAGTGLGTLTGSVLSAQAAIVTTFVTALRGRSYRGRSYLAGRVTADLDSVVAYSNTRRSAVQGAYEALPGRLNDNGFNHVVLSRQLNNVRRTTGVATVVTAYTTRINVYTQRRRLD